MVYSIVFLTLLLLAAIYAAPSVDSATDSGKTTVVTTSTDAPKTFKGYLFFEIHTANERGAGSDSNIYITVVGTKANLTRRMLKTVGPSVNAFERNQVDICVLYTNIKFDKIENPIRGIELSSDGKWAGSAWKPSCIYISGIDAAQTNNQWIIEGNPVFISFAQPNRDVCYT